MIRSRPLRVDTMKLTRIQKEKWIPLFAAGLVVVLDQCA
ncbi:signal peptidase II, partial [Treponema pallidum subsp. pallidum]